MAARDTIVALSSGAPPSGVAVVRISGPHAGALLEEMLGKLPPPRRLTLAPIRIAGALIDSGLVAFMPGPASFTGEDCAELHVHGSRAVLRALLRILPERPGFRLAGPGEFTRRAFENGRLDLTSVEGIGDLIAAETESQRSQALARMQGGLAQRLEAWRGRLLELRAEIEARLDFSDEGDVGDLPAGFRSDLLGLAGEIGAMAGEAGRGRIVREGLRVALAGPPNAGKSSLLNALVKSEVAIVTDEPGTTRDVREVHVDLGGRLVTLLDMAGLRETDSRAEAEGVRRAAREIGLADLVLWLVAPDTKDIAPPQTTAPLWRIGTKADLGSVDPVDLAVSVRSGHGLDALFARLSAYAGERGGDSPALVSRARDEAALREARSALDRAAAESRPELLAEELRHASAALERLLGRMDAEQVLDRLFASFCIGK